MSNEMNYVNEPKPGRYLHYKGGTYLLVSVGTFTGNSSELNQARVCYYYILYPTDLPWGELCCRPVSEWQERVKWNDNIERPRFDLLVHSIYDKPNL